MSDTRLILFKFVYISLTSFWQQWKELLLFAYLLIPWFNEKLTIYQSNKMSMWLQTLIYYEIKINLSKKMDVELEYLKFRFTWFEFLHVISDVGTEIWTPSRFYKNLPWYNKKDGVTFKIKLQRHNNTCLDQCYKPLKLKER